MAFTFYADLLGIASAYKLGPEIAYERLNQFYNTTFEALDPWAQKSGTKVLMFSDSLLVYGDDDLLALKHLSALYLKLLERGLLLRGAIVEGCLMFDPRLERHTFRKFLPQDDALARAVGLEKTQKGARFLIEPQLARRLLQRHKAWLTNEGYLDNFAAAGSTASSSILRRICPTPDSLSYEMLYFWPPRNGGQNFAQLKERLKTLATMVTDDLAQHYKETEHLMMRCQSRNQLHSGISPDKRFMATHPLRGRPL